VLPLDRHDEVSQGDGAACDEQRDRGDRNRGLKWLSAAAQDERKAAARDRKICERGDAALGLSRVKPLWRSVANRYCCESAHIRGGRVGDLGGQADQRAAMISTPANSQCAGRRPAHLPQMHPGSRGNLPSTIA
jgi:hypothetical protein